MSDKYSNTQELSGPPIRHSQVSQEAHEKALASISNPSNRAEYSSTLEAGEILRIVPVNELAKESFDALLKDENARKLGHHHKKFLVETGTGPLKTSLAKASARDREETPETDMSETVVPNINIGYYRVSFDYHPLKKGVKWSAGRGSHKFGETRNVDILLAVPGMTKFTHQLSMSHMILSMHTQSGAWIVRAVEPMALAGTDLQAGESRALHKTKTRCMIAEMEFSIEFAIDTLQKEHAYQEARDQYLKEIGVVAPSTKVSGIPFSNDLMVESAVFRHGLKSGTFGHVFEGFDCVSGDLRVVKKLIMSKHSMCTEISREIEALTRLRGTKGIIQMYGWRNSRGAQEVFNTEFPMEIFIVQERGRPMQSYDWTQHQDFALQTSLFQQLLEGLVAIHSIGWMHRDITMSNILFFGDTQEAKLIDFGKICFHKTATETNLAAWAFLPPEIEEGRYNLYDQSLDIWELAQALTRCWLRLAFRDLKERESGNVRAFNEDHNKLIKRLQKANGNFPLGDELAKLLAEMMQWDPKRRPTATQTLKHPLFANLRE